MGFNCHNMFIYLLEWSGFPGMLQKKSCMFHICAYKIPSVKHMFHKFSYMFHTWKYMEHPWTTHEHMSGIYKNMFSLHRPYIGLIYGRYLQSIGSWNSHWFGGDFTSNSGQTFSKLKVRPFLWDATFLTSMDCLPAGY